MQAEQNCDTMGAPLIRGGDLQADNVVIDGEAVCLLKDSRPDFHALRSRQACRDARLIADDLVARTPARRRCTSAGGDWKLC